MKRLIPGLLLAAAMISGCGDSNDFNEVSGQQGGGGLVGIEPQAIDDLYATDQNEAFSLAAAQGVLANDQVNTNNPAAITVTFPGNTVQGGTISAPANDGSFTYSPAVGFTGTDTFTYTLNNGFGASSATVSIVVDAAQVQQGFIVDSATGNDATGNFDTGAPFATIQGAVNAAPINADITVRPGNYTGAVTLKNGQRLLGSGSTQVNTQGVIRPTLTGPVNLADGNTLDFLRIAGTNGDAVNGDGQNSGTVTNCEIANATNQGRGIAVNPGVGTWTITGNTITNAAGLGVDLTTNGTGQMRAQVNDNTITGSAFDAIGFLAEGSSNLTAQIRGNTMTGNQRQATFEAIAGNNATLSLDIEDNTNDDVYVFARELSATMNIEQLAQLETLNTGTVVITTGALVGPPTDVADGFCGF